MLQMGTRLGTRAGLDKRYGYLVIESGRLALKDLYMVIFFDLFDIIAILTSTEVLSRLVSSKLKIILAFDSLLLYRHISDRLGHVES